MASSNDSSLHGLNRTATGFNCAANERVRASLRPEISIVGTPRPDPLSFSHISIPVISGMCMSATKQAFEVGISLASTSAALPKVLTQNPEVERSLYSERRHDASSSTTRTVAGLSGLASLFVSAALATVLMSLAQPFPQFSSKLPIQSSQFGFLANRSR